jgi:predicted transcriptional regulator
MTKINELIVSALKRTKNPQLNYEIRDYVQAKRPNTSPATIDTALNLAAAKGLIFRNQVKDRGRAKYQYFFKKPPKVNQILLNILAKTSKLSSHQLYLKAKEIESSVTPVKIDTSLYYLSSLSKKIIKSKNPMTDSNSRSHSKYLYSIK